MHEEEKHGVHGERKVVGIEGTCKVRKGLKVEWEKMQTVEQKENYASKKEERLGSVASSRVLEPG